VAVDKHTQHTTWNMRLSRVHTNKLIAKCCLMLTNFILFYGNMFRFQSKYKIIRNLSCLEQIINETHRNL